MASTIPPGLSLDMIPSEPPPLGVQPNFLHPLTLGNEIIAVSVVTSVLAVVFLCTRLYSTLRITRSAWYDDITTVLATVFSLAYVALIIHTRDHSRHGWDLPISAFTSTFFKIILAETLVCALSIFLSKLSILLLLYRLFAVDKKFRYCVYIGILWVSLILIATVVVVLVLCVPRSGEAFSSLQVVERCTHQDIWAVIQGPLNVLLDFYILYIPIPILWKLKLGQRKKIGVIAIFMTGFIACLASVLSLAFKAKLVASSDTLFNSFRVDILNIVEVNVAIMVACMPACASFLRFFSAKGEFLSALRVRLSSARSSLTRLGKNSSTPKHASTSKAAVGIRRPPRSTEVSTDKDGRYWKVKNNLFSTDKDGLPPQITANRRQSCNLATERLDVCTRDDKSWHLEGDYNGNAEVSRSSREDEAMSSRSPHRMV